MSSSRSPGTNCTGVAQQPHSWNKMYWEGACSCVETRARNSSVVPGSGSVSAGSRRYGCPGSTIPPSVLNSTIPGSLTGSSRLMTGGSSIPPPLCPFTGARIRHGLGSRVGELTDQGRQARSRGARAPPTRHPSPPPRDTCPTRPPGQYLMDRRYDIPSDHTQ
eukprot:901315-Rhodomonas_salina.2